MPEISPAQTSYSDQFTFVRVRYTSGGVNFRMRNYFGAQRFVAGKDFGDFVVWRQDGILPARWFRLNGKG